MTAVPESTLLAPRDAARTNPDDWPEFRLTDAYATLPGSREQEPTSLLLATEWYPLTVTGRLAPPTAANEHLWKRKDGGKKGTSMVVENVRSFAYGSYEDGSVGIWAAGQAGWFVMQPGRAYKSMYSEMCAAVKTLFFVVDAYTEPEIKQKGKNVTQTWSELSPDQFFQHYAREELGDETRTAEAAEAIYQHKDFLLSSMIAGKEGMAWSRNPLYKHLCKTFPGDLRAVRERSAPPAQRPKLSLSRQASEDSASTTSSLKRKRGRPSKNKPVDVISIASSSAASSVKKDVPQRPPTSRSETQKAKPSRNLADRLPGTRRMRNNSPSIPPRSATPEVEDSATPAQNNDSEDSSEDELASGAGKGKSALRLKPTKPMKGPPKGPSRSGKAPLEDDAEPRSSPIPSKRRRDEPTNPRRPKRRNSKSEEDEGIDIPSSPSSPSNPDEMNPDPDTTAGAPSLADSLAMHKPDPLQESTWLCALDGCIHKVYGDPSDPVSQRLIREHYALHAYDDDERVQLVKRLQAPSLPVGHLMERVRVAAKGEGFPGSRVAGTRFPEPVRTRY